MREMYIREDLLRALAERRKAVVDLTMSGTRDQFEANKGRANGLDEAVQVVDVVFSRYIAEENR